MERINFTAKCSKCLTCAEYMYGCRGCNSMKETDICEGYEFDEYAYVRQDRDETYIPSYEKKIEELNERLDFKNTDKEKITIIYTSNWETLKTLYLTHIPKIDDNIEINDITYVVTECTMCINSDNDLPEWKIFVK